jgi:hypothetical protein
MSVMKVIGSADYHWKPLWRPGVWPFHFSKSLSSLPSVE